MVLLNTVGANLIKGDNPSSTSNYIMIAINAFAVVVILIIDSVLIYKIKRYNKLLYAKPIYGKIEDIIVLTSGKGDSRNHDICILIRRDNDDKLYFTYGDNDLSGFNSSYSGNGRTVSSIHIRRNDNKETNIGDPIKFYISEIYTEYPRLEIIHDSKIRMEKRNYIYQHINHKYDINSFKDYVFYEGFIELI